MRERVVLSALVLGLALALCGWWASGGGGVPATVESAERAPPASRLEPARLAGMAPHARQGAALAPELEQEGGAEPGARRPTSTSHGRLWLEGRVTGVHPDDLEDLVLEIGCLLLVDLPAEGGRSERVSFHVASRALGPAPPLEPDGSFRVDLGARLAKYRGPMPGGIVLSASHALYFAARVRLELGPASLVPPPEGSECVLRMEELRLEPAAVLRGKIERPILEEGTLDAEQMKADPLLLVIREQLQMRASAAPNAPDMPEQSLVRMLAREPVILSSSFTRFLGGDIELALFPLHDGRPARQPSATHELHSDGDFELKLREGGPFLLVALVADARPLSRSVDLHLREVVELEPQALELGASLAGLVQGLGVLPEESLEVRARRADAALLPPLAWKDGRLGAIGERVEWLERRATVDAGGRFTLAGLAPGELHCVEVLPRGRALVDPASLAERAGARGCGASLSTLAPASGLELLFPASLLVVTASLEGEPLHEAAQRLAPTEEDTPAPTFALELACPELGRSSRLEGIEDDERLLLVLEPGREYHLELTGPGCEPAAATIVAPPAGQATQLALDLARN